MKYYVVSDVHSFYTELYNILEEKGFFEEKEQHKLIICGDLFDRGKEALKMQSFILDLMEKDMVILIRGNHEDLMLDLINDWDKYSYNKKHHNSNGTVDTVLQVTEKERITEENKLEIKEKIINTPFIKRIISSMIDYYETNNYIFVHGWIPCNALGFGGRAHTFYYMNDWRKAQSLDWTYARWYNGMDAAVQGVIEPGKTIICGHFHSSFGHSKIEGKCSEFGDDADFSPFISNGIIAIDACTVHSGKVNCIVIEE